MQTLFSHNSDFQASAKCLTLVDGRTPITLHHHCKNGLPTIFWYVIKIENQYTFFDIREAFKSPSDHDEILMLRGLNEIHFEYFNECPKALIKLVEEIVGKGITVFDGGMRTEDEGLKINLVTYKYAKEILHGRQAEIKEILLGEQKHYLIQMPDSPLIVGKSWLEALYAVEQNLQHKFDLPF